MVIRELITRLAFASDATGAKKYDAELERVERHARGTAAAVTGMSAAIGTAIGNFAANAAQAIGAALVSATKSIPLAGDAMRKSIATINSELDNTAEAERIYDRLYQAVRQTGGGLDESAKSFAKWNLTLSEVGKTTDDTVDMVTGLQAAFAASGKGKSEINSIIEQLGDALSAKKLSGDEFKSLKESLPEFIKFLREKLGKSSEELEKLADDQKLALDLWLDPLMEFARRGSAKLAAAPLRMELAWEGLKTTAGRLAADLDKILGLSEGIAKGLKGIADGLEAIRRRLPAIREFIDRLGGLRTSLMAAGAMLALYFGPTAVAMIRLLTIAMWSLARSVIVAFLPLAGIVAWFIIIEDFISWLQGKRSLTGDKFGDFKTVKENAIAVFQAVKDYILSTFEGLKDRLLGWFAPIGAQLAKDAAAISAVFEAVWTVLSAKARVFGDALAAVSEAIRIAFVAMWDGLEEKARTFGDALSAVGAAVRAALEAMFAPVLAVIDKAKAGAEWLGSQLGLNAGPDGTTSDPAAQEQRRRNFQNRMQGLYPEPDEQRRNFQDRLQGLSPEPGATVAPGPSSWNAPQNNDIDIQVSVNASGNSGAEVAAGARNGVAQAARDMVADLGGLARNLSMANPRAETAAA